MQEAIYFWRLRDEEMSRLAAVLNMQHDLIAVQEAIYYGKLRDDEEDLLAAVLKMNNAASR